VEREEHGERRVDRKLEKKHTRVWGEDDVKELWKLAGVSAPALLALLDWLKTQGECVGEVWEKSMWRSFVKAVAHPSMVAGGIIKRPWDTTHILSKLIEGPSSFFFALTFFNPVF
jgi:hypothetical protein